ncbi:MAG: hypothetical protein HN402_07875 [Candidatus Scalindua sp.]|jgi:hypothetical protein|nr:hypothetical protein [Candidatus Scalindua sp.]MBT6757774.1 hypothetical protein [Candidatus Jacksonbacteria bacterium]
MQDQVVNQNDFKVVSFHNPTDFHFTPDMGCMYGGQGINGATGNPGVQAGETMTLPYHVGRLLAKNLAKQVLNTSEPATVDKKGVPTGVPIWNEESLQKLTESYLTDLYSEEKPAVQSETQVLLGKVEEYRKLTEDLLNKVGDKEKIPTSDEPPKADEKKVYLDKQEVLAELDKRQIKHDKRASKVELEKLLA